VSNARRCDVCGEYYQIGEVSGAFYLCYVVKPGSWVDDPGPWDICGWGCLKTIVQRGELPADQSKQEATDDPSQ
jgi:hypothetical protein